MAAEPPVQTRPAPAAPAQVGEATTGEARLVRAVLSRDRQAAAELVSLHADAIYAYVKRRLAPRTELVDDLVQEVFLAAFTSMAGFQGTSPLRVWLLGIARHKVESYYRQQLRRAVSLDDEGPEPQAAGLSADELLDRDRVEARTQVILGMLPEPYGIVLLWRYWENRSAREIAAAIGKTEKAVERLLARARARFREHWEA